MSSNNPKPPAEGKSGLGECFKGLESGEVIQMRTEWNKLWEGPRIAITHIEYKNPDWLFYAGMIATFYHFYKLTKECCDKGLRYLRIG